MGRHRSHDILDKVVSGTLPVDQEPPKITPKGNDGSSLFETPTELLLPLGSHERKKEDPGIIYEQHMSPNERTGLGRYAVHVALNAAHNAREDFEMKPENEHIQKARDRLQKITQSDDKSEQFQQLILNQPKSEWIEERLGIDREAAKDNPRLLVDKLLARNGQGYAVSDETFLNFLEWHNHVLAERQHELDQQIEVIKDEYKQDIRRAVAEGWMPNEVLTRLDKIDKARIYLDDGLNTDMSGAHGHTRAVPQNDYSVVVLSPNQLDNPRKTLRHEFDHVLDGQDYEREDFPEHTSRPPISHGLYRLVGAEEGGMILNEAVTEHVRSSLDNGEVDIIDPSHKKRQGSYRLGRRLLNTLANAGVKGVDIRLFIAAFFEDNVNIKKRESKTQELYDQLKEAFPFANVAREINGFTKDTNINNYIADLHMRVMRYKDLHPRGYPETS